jgi:hypothetical protein
VLAGTIPGAITALAAVVAGREVYIRGNMEYDTESKTESSP